MRSRLNYCVESWGNALLTNTLSLHKTQKEVLCTIFNKPSGSELLQKSWHLDSWKHLYKLRLGELALISFHHSLQPVATYSTRSSALALSLPSVIKMDHHWVEYQSSPCCYALPDYIHKIETKTHFCMALRQQLIFPYSGPSPMRHPLLTFFTAGLAPWLTYGYCTIWLYHFSLCSCYQLKTLCYNCIWL